jgi:hypothetical protein
MRAGANAKRIVGTIRYWIWATWPGAPMAGATVVGLALGVAAVLYVLPVSSEIEANLSALGVMFAVQVLTFAWVVRASRIAAARAQAVRYRALLDQLEERDPDVLTHAGYPRTVTLTRSSLHQSCGFIPSSVWSASSLISDPSHRG